MIEISGRPKSSYVPLHLQPIFRVAQLLLILNFNTGKGKSATISLLQTVLWSIRTDKNLKKELNYSKIPGVFEPALDRVLILAIANGYCSKLKGGKIKITPKGKEIIKIILDNNLFQNQVVKLNEIGDVSKYF